MAKELLILKWGTIKGWKNLGPVSAEKVAEVFGDRQSLSAMADRLDDRQRQKLCEAIDAIDGEILNDWTGEIMTKDAAKKYVMGYAR